jgi:hypothetical protein
LFKKRNILILGMLAAVLALGLGAAVALAESSDDGPAAPADWRPGPGPGLRHDLLGGEVVKVDGNAITIKKQSGEEKTVTVNDQTRYRKPPDGEASLADVKAGEKVGIRLDREAEGDQLVARAVIVGEPPQDGVHRGRPMIGEVTAVDGDTLTISTPDGDKQIKIPPVEVGSRVGVINAPDGTVRGMLFNVPDRPADDEAGAPDDGGFAPAA